MKLNRKYLNIPLIVISTVGWLAFEYYEEYVPYWVGCGLVVICIALLVMWVDYMANGE